MWGEICFIKRKIRTRNVTFYQKKHFSRMNYHETANNIDITNLKWTPHTNISSRIVKNMRPVLGSCHVFH
jgi:hypothetical protein